MSSQFENPLEARLIRDGWLSPEESGRIVRGNHVPLSALGLTPAGYRESRAPRSCPECGWDKRNGHTASCSLRVHYKPQPGWISPVCSPGHGTHLMSGQLADVTCSQCLTKVREDLKSPVVHPVAGARVSGPELPAWTGTECPDCGLAKLPEFALCWSCEELASVRNRIRSAEPGRSVSCAAERNRPRRLFAGAAFCGLSSFILSTVFPSGLVSLAPVPLMLAAIVLLRLGWNRRD